MIEGIIHGDALAVLRTLPDESVHCVVTSPPYWGLRDYGVEGQLGLEKTPEEYIERMVEVFREVRRVLRSDGTLWLNMGDSYAGSWGNQGRKEERGTQRPINGDMMQPVHDGRYPANESNTGACPPGLKPKDLVGMPWRLAFALQADGWYLRSDIIWHKPNPMPESVTDRPTKAHEYLFLLSKRPRYFYDAEAIREEAAYPDGPNSPQSIKSPHGQGFTRRAAGNAKTFRGGGAYTEGQSKVNGAIVERDSHGNEPNPSGKRNKRTVWTIATQAMPEAHFATFPEKLVEPCIRAGTSERGVCPDCGAPWVRAVDVEYENPGNRTTNGPRSIDNKHEVSAGYEVRLERRSTTTGWDPSCECGGDPIPAIVLEPFCGAATTPLVAKKLGRHFVAIELSAEYIEISNRRLGEVALWL